MEAVRQALYDGKDSPKDGVAFVKERFGLEMSVNHFSNYKSKLQGTKGSGRKGKRKPKKRKAGPETMLAATVVEFADVPTGRPRTRRPKADDTLSAARDVWQLCDRYGVETVKGLAVLFGE